MPFQTLNLAPPILRAIQDAGYTEPTPIQVAAIPPVLAGHDLIGIAQTGTGKTAAFTWPMLHRLASRTDAPNARRGTRALILAPTRELAAQIEENVRAYARHLPLRMATVFGGVGEGPQKQALRAGVDLVIATPGRLLDLMGQGFGDFSALEFLVLDEADRMLDMGFLPDIRRILRALPAQRQTLLFAATFAREIEALSHQFLRAPKLVQIGRRANPAETVAQSVYEIPPHAKFELLFRLLEQPGMDSVLVFTRTKHGADKVARRLDQARIRTATLHSNRSQSQRLRALKDFKSGAVRVLVATDIAARGIDVEGISHVVNFDFPKHPEDYVHRIGRTGRAHAVGDAISLVTPEDYGALRALERFIGRGLLRRRVEGFVPTPAPAPSLSAPRPAFRDRSPHGSRPPHARPEAGSGPRDAQPFSRTPHGPQKARPGPGPWRRGQGARPWQARRTRPGFRKPHR